MKETGNFTFAVEQKDKSYKLNIYTAEYRGPFQSVPHTQEVDGKKVIATLKVKVVKDGLDVNVISADSKELNLFATDEFKIKTLDGATISKS